jgi:hypothetical protein
MSTATAAWLSVVIIMSAVSLFLLLTIKDYIHHGSKYGFNAYSTAMLTLSTVALIAWWVVFLI